MAGNSAALEITIEDRVYISGGRQLAELKVMKTGGDESMVAFDFLIGYPSMIFLDMSIEPGEIFDSTFKTHWEYLDYEVYSDTVLINDTLLSLIRINGRKNQNPENRILASTVLPDGTVLFTLHFFIPGNLICTDTPIRFVWCNCENNTIDMIQMSGKNDITIERAVSKSVYDFKIWRSVSYGKRDLSVFPSIFPTINGSPDSCAVNAANRLIDFHNGLFVLTNNPCIEEKGYGDVNNNGIGYEIADAFLFKKYFVYGLDSFVIYTEGQIAATEVFPDNNPLTVRDFVYLCQIIYGDVIVPPTKIRDSINMQLDLDYAENELLISAAYDKPVAAVHLIFGLNGCLINSIYSHPDINNMSIEYSEKSDTLRIFICPRDIFKRDHILDIPAANLLKLTFTGERPDLLSAQAAGRMSEKVKLIIND